MKQVLLLLALVPALSFAVWTNSVQAGGPGDSGTGAKQPLDLPAGGLNADEDDEDAPETINFYGSEYEGQAFFWCFHAFNF
jgi:hypothetical protein